MFDCPVVVDVIKTFPVPIPPPMEAAPLPPAPPANDPPSEVAARSETPVNTAFPPPTATTGKNVLTLSPPAELPVAV